MPRTNHPSQESLSLSLSLLSPLAAVAFGSTAPAAASATVMATSGTCPRLRTRTLLAGDLSLTAAEGDLHPPAGVEPGECSGSLLSSSLASERAVLEDLTWIFFFL